jgi:hypothetical protein
METPQESDLSASNFRQRAYQWPAAALAGVAVGFWFLLFPRGIPWSSVTFFSAAVMGRMMPPTIPFLSAVILHLGLSACYGLIIGAVVFKPRLELALLAGTITASGLYLLNRAVIDLVFPSVSGHESAVLVTHILFGLFTAGAYRGLVAR